MALETKICQKILLENLKCIPNKKILIYVICIYIYRIKLFNLINQIFHTEPTLRALLIKRFISRCKTQT